MLSSCAVVGLPCVDVHTGNLEAICHPGDPATLIVGLPSAPVGSIGHRLSKATPMPCTHLTGQMQQIQSARGPNAAQLIVGGADLLGTMTSASWAIGHSNPAPSSGTDAIDVGADGFNQPSPPGGSRRSRRGTPRGRCWSGPMNSARSLVILPLSTVSMHTVQCCEVRDFRRAIDLAPVRKPLRPREDRGDRVGRGRLRPAGAGDSGASRCRGRLQPRRSCRPGVISTEVIRPSEPKPWATVSDCTSPS